MSNAIFATHKIASKEQWQGSEHAKILHRIPVLSAAGMEICLGIKFRVSLL